MNNKELDKLLQTCEQEQLHLSGMIQPFGSIIVINENNLIITHVAENINEFINFSVDELLGKRIETLLPNWMNYFKLLDEKLDHPYVYQKIKDENIYLKISKTDDNFIVDIQKISQKAKEKVLNRDMNELYITPDSEESYKDYLQTYMQMVSETINFDRIMLYQFQDDWSGKVVAEKILSNSYGSYLDLRFPASDIPKIARELYVLNPSRIIADTKAKNVDIIALPKNIPDLTYSDTRSVSPVHIEYLKNMGVESSFSIPIIISNKLWGLLACHNFKKKLLDPITKNAAIEETKLFSLGIQNYLAKEKLNYIDLIEHKVNDIADLIINKGLIEDEIMKNQNRFLNLISSDGFILVIDNHITSFGNLPDNNSFIYLDNTFMSNTEISLVSNSISNELFEDNHYLGPAGVLGIKLRINNHDVRSYWFRNEFIEELHWAGNPNKPVIENAGALQLSPRRSFEEFIEIKRGFSKKFTTLEISAGLKFANTFFRYLVKEK
ncbi:GAF domain-containing protein [Arcobacter sp. LA11]|uniref:GAF domain-containing protein n=1 Tax=Arcobacter sp. LA11 TaxID=1898176 RepID=UPI000934F660|nr:GAF domain-containing protein [Arcobacter sp. LA11]